MKNRALNFVVSLSVVAAFAGCSTTSKTVNGSPRGGDLSDHPDQMRVVTEGTVFQPLARVDLPQFQGLQTPLAGGGRQRLQSNRPITLPKFTAVKILATKSSNILVQLADGRRGYLPMNSVAKESEILAAAQPATPLDSAIDPSTGLPYPNSNESLYLPEMNVADAPVDEAMLNNIDSIPLPESELQPLSDPEAEEVDGIILRKTSAKPEGKPDLANSPANF